MDDEKIASIEIYYEDEDGDLTPDDSWDIPESIFRTKILPLIRKYGVKEGCAND